MSRTGAGAITYWKANQRDALGHVSHESFGNGLHSVLDYDQVTGTLGSILTGSTLGSEVQSLSYRWDKVGNLLSRTDQNQSGQRDTFAYDALDRLKSATLSSPQALQDALKALGYTQLTSENVNAVLAYYVAHIPTPLTLTYDAIGNIKSKSDVGTYSYDAAHPHAVALVTGTRAATYSYDANGNMLSGAGRTLSWTSFNKPHVISAGANRSTFRYTPEHTRYAERRDHQLADGAQKNQLIYHIGGIYEWRSNQSPSPSGIDVRHYIQANGQTVAVDEKKADGTSVLHYLHHDHLGSVTAITNSDGSVNQRLSFDAFGKRRQGDWTADPQDALYKQSYATDRGYTGQEQLDNVKLVNFHARLYDPVLGRFISPDSVVQFPDSTQGLNRYTYVNNNPLSYTDPDGHCIIICSTVAIYAAIVGSTAAAVGEITHNALVTQIGFSILGAATGNIEAASAVGFGAGFTESGGNLKAGLYAAATAAAFYEVGSAFQVGSAGTESGAAAEKFGQHAVLRYETHVVADGLVGGVSSEVMGGGFKSGFIGAGFGEAASGLLSKAPFSNIPGINSVAGNVTASALIGGTASELSGGKFANGAVTAAFAAGFNAEAHRIKQRESEFDKLSQITGTRDPITGASPLVTDTHQLGMALTVGAAVTATAPYTLVSPGSRVSLLTRLADRALFGTFDVATGLGARAATGAESLMIRGLTTSVRMGMNPAVAIPAAIDAAEGFISPTPPENLEQLGGFAASKARGFTIKQ